MLLNWKRLIIHKTFIEYSSSLAVELDVKRKLLVATNGTKIDVNGNSIAHEGTTIFGN